MYGRPPSRTQWPRCPDLPPDLLREISGRLLHVSNFVRFHAVCRAWRSSYDPSTTKNRSFLPWLLAPSTNEDDPLNLRCVFSKKTYLAPPLSQPWPNWAGGADGSALRYFTALPYPRLHDPLVTRGAPIAMQASFPYPKGQWLESPSGIVYRDGTILLYKNSYPSRGKADFKAAIMHPGHATWMVVERTLKSPDYGELSVAYHGGKILVTEDASLWHVLTPGTEPHNHDLLVPRPWKAYEHNDYWYENIYVLESRGELLWVIVTVPENYSLHFILFYILGQ